MPFGTLSVVLGVRPVQWLELLFAPGVTLEYPSEPLGIPQRFANEMFVFLDGPMVSGQGSFAIAVHLPRGWRVAPEATVLMTMFPARFGFLLRPYFGLSVFKEF
jgi:hypothetical protein